MPRAHPAPSAMSDPQPRPEHDCDAALAAIGRFGGSDLGAEEHRELRAHLAHCPTCTASYREAVRAAASLSRVGAAEREARREARQLGAFHMRLFGREAPRRTRGWRWRLVAIPAFFIWLLSQIGGMGTPPARVELVSHRGAVRVDGRPVRAESEPLLVLPGRWVRTRDTARAELGSPLGSLLLGDRTEVLVESAGPLRLRLRAGRLDVEGDLTVVTVLGLVEVREGRGRLRLDDRGLELEPESGTWRHLGASGETTPVLGRRTLIEPDRLRLP